MLGGGGAGLSAQQINSGNWELSLPRTRPPWVPQTTLELPPTSE